jgi:hypothetical protein
MLKTLKGRWISRGLYTAMTVATYSSLYTGQAYMTENMVVLESAFSVLDNLTFA